MRTIFAILFSVGLVSGAFAFDCPHSYESVQLDEMTPVVSIDQEPKAAMSTHDPKKVEELVSEKPRLKSE